MQPVAINYMLLMPIEMEDVDGAAGGDVDLYVQFFKRKITSGHTNLTASRIAADMYGLVVFNDMKCVNFTVYQPWDEETTRNGRGDHINLWSGCSNTFQIRCPN